MKSLIFKTIILSLLLPALIILMWNPVEIVSATATKDLQNSNSSGSVQNTAKPIRKDIKIRKYKKHKKHYAKRNH